MKEQIYIESPCGILEVSAEQQVITSILFVDQFVSSAPHQNQLLLEAKHQLEAYFEGRLNTFDLPYELKGTPFQQLVWQALASIPYGVTISYSELAEQIKNPKAVRAVGAANGKNPLSIIIPCHRVIGKNNTLTGYAGGLNRKQFLLNLEHEHASHAKQLNLL